MIIDSHGHYTTAPDTLWEWRDRQIKAVGDPASAPKVSELSMSDDDLRASLESQQLRLQAERGTDLAIFSPRASRMQHHIGDEQVSRVWTELANDVIYRVCNLYPKNFVGVAQLPQSPAAPPANSIPEMQRTVNELGFVGVNLNPDPSGGMWTGLPLFDRSWYPVYEKLCELDVPAMIHVSESCNPNFHMTGAHYIAADTTAFMQLITSTIFTDFPDLKLIIPHGGGAVPYHWGRYRGLAQDIDKPPLEELLMHNVFFDTCVYHQAGIDLLFKVIPLDNILFASEMIGAVRGIDPETGHYYDDTKNFVDQVSWLTEADRQAVYEDNIYRVYPRLRAQIEKQAAAV
jgi:4-oxalmesaconate hydratase